MFVLHLSCFALFSFECVFPAFSILFRFFLCVVYHSNTQLFSRVLIPCLVCASVVFLMLWLNISQNIFTIVVPCQKKKTHCMRKVNATSLPCFYISFFSFLFIFLISHSSARLTVYFFHSFLVETSIFSVVLYCTTQFISLSLLVTSSFHA